MKKLAFLLLLISAALCGCVYHPPFQQGNVLTASKTQSIHKGMTSEQVRTVLGSPVLENMFSDNRMTYIYTDQPKYNERKTKRFIVTFQNDEVVNIQSDIAPEIPHI